MSHGFHVPPDARARSKMLSAHLEESNRKHKEVNQQLWQSRHLKTPPANHREGGKPRGD